MCGLCGELRFDGQDADLAALARMSARLTRRGPDHGGSFSDGPLGLGHRRLSIIDISERAHQPLVDPTLGVALVFNGTLYNYRELRKTLQDLGFVFFSQGDTEVIAKAWRAWGEGCVERFQGMFAIALWDRRARCLFLARDRFGIKPLYWTRDSRRLRFASTPQALLAGGEVDRDLDPIALHFLFTLHGVVPAPRTVLQGVRKIPPAEWLRVDAEGQTQSQAYWQLEATRPASPPSEADWIAMIRDRLLLAVKSHNDIADVPVGVLLSGGLDSSLLVALLAEAGIHDFHTFSIGFEDQPEEKGSEFDYSDPVAARYQTRHHRFLIPNREVLPRLPEAVAEMSEPMFGQDAVAFYLLAEQVSREIRVVQSGQGADEVFGGYFWYPRMQAETDKNPLARFRRHYFDRDHEEFLHLVTPHYQGADHTGIYINQRLTEPGAETFLDQVLRLDVTALIVDDPVKRVDNMTMAFGLEARVPFLDHPLVELAARCPPELKLRDQGKFPLKAIARGLLPDEVIDRPKGYFPMPALKYVRGGFLDFMRDLLTSDTCHQRGLYQEDYLKRLLAAPELHHTRIQGSKLWQLALLELWLQTLP
ncbi:asparagine synthase (glutamine-hydrolysing) [Gammaproteobacteria bacterium]